MVDVVINNVTDAATGAGAILRCAGFEFTCPQLIAVKQIDVYTVLAGHSFKANIYSKVSTNPSAKLGTDSNVATSILNGVVTLTFPTAITLAAGTNYFLGVVTSTSQNFLGANNALTLTRRNGQTLADINTAMSDPFAQGSTTANHKLPYLVLRSTQVSISDIDQLETAETSTANFNENFAPTQFSISADGIIKTSAATITDADTATFVPAQWLDNQTCIPVGGVTVTATNGTDTTTNFSDDYSVNYGHPDDATPVPFTAINLLSVSSDSLDAAISLSPAWAVGTQVLFDATRGSVNTAGEWVANALDPFTGQQYIWYRNPDDKIARLVLLTTQDGIPVMPADTSVSVQAGATTLGTFLATSGTAPITYSLTGTSAGLFNINPSTAVVTFASAAAVGSGSINVVATNSEGSDSQTVSFVVTPVLTGDSDVTLQSGRVEAREQLAVVRTKLAYQADSVAATVTDLRTDFNSLISKMNTRGWFTGGEVQTTMLKVAMQNGLIQFLNRIKTQAPNQMDVQSASVAADVAALRTDFNALLTKLKAANLMATS